VSGLLVINTFGSFTSLTHSFGVSTTTKLGPKKLETLFFRMLQNAFRYFDPFRRGLRVWQTDRQRDRRTDWWQAVFSSSAL